MAHRRKIERIASKIYRRLPEPLITPNPPTKAFVETMNSWVSIDFEVFKLRHFVNGRIPKGNVPRFGTAMFELTYNTLGRLKEVISIDANVSVQQYARKTATTVFNSLDNVINSLENDLNSLENDLKSLDNVSNSLENFQQPSIRLAEMATIYAHHFHKTIADSLDENKSLEDILEYEFMVFSNTTFSSTKTFMDALENQLYVRMMLRFADVCCKDATFKKFMIEEEEEEEEERKKLARTDYLLCLEYMIVNKQKTGAYTRNNKFTKSSPTNATSARKKYANAQKNKVYSPKVEAQMANIQATPFVTAKRDDTIESERPKDNTRYYAFVQVGKDAYQYVIDTIDNINEYAERIVFKDTSGIPVRAFKQKTIAMVIKRKRSVINAKWSKNTFHFKPNDNMNMDDIIDIIQSSNE